MTTIKTLELLLSEYPLVTIAKSCVEYETFPNLPHGEYVLTASASEGQLFLLTDANLDRLISKAWERLSYIRAHGIIQ